MKTTKGDVACYKILSQVSEPLRIPLQWEEAPSKELDKPIANPEPPANHYEQFLADFRFNILKQFAKGMVTRKQAMVELELGKSQFYKLLEQFKQATDYTALLREKRGTKKGSVRCTPGQKGLMQLAYDDKYQLGGTIAAVYAEAERLCKKMSEVKVTKHMVRTFVLAKPKKERDYRTLGKEKADQIYKPKPKKKIMDLALRQVQMDHTQVDLLLVHEFRKDIIIGRPWVTMIICALTRVILGFYLSLFRPNVRTVSAALAFAVLRKTPHMEYYSKSPEEYPFFGIPWEIYTDNAAEFLSQQLILKCARWGMTWNHRPVDKKWYGGIVERVIGTFMTTAVHFLPGTTGSNVLEREKFDSEKNACYDFPTFCEWFMEEVTRYHGTVHQSLGCTPRQAWEYYERKGMIDPSRVVEGDAVRELLIDFMPSKDNCHVHNYGVNFAARRFNHDALNLYRGEKVDIRYNPVDLNSVYCLLGNQFLEVPATYTKPHLSNNWESYSFNSKLASMNTVIKNASVGDIDDPFAHQAMERQDQLTAEAKASKAKWQRSTAKIKNDLQGDFIEGEVVESFPNVLLVLDRDEEGHKDKQLQKPSEPKKDSTPTEEVAYTPKIFIDPLDI
ncbi:transposase [Pantoea sp. Tr-811]|uniref:Mu transposase C-terminal domain-containing protein n=1 Tax=Pantoea sp. Tr-811 TaxID=2608361 RepID=UPI001423C9D6|nr:Mu transposase C-terminal domain-containing protein [Pantoea sp. Tr-811]NIF28871.1 transposase [Pantoea sp. Tr-811]